ncbi:MAG: CpsB/CapC family capsule biosynthesis tyrosine phosphatase [Acidobacteriota bacterium]
MIDIHSHILAGLDDGAKTLEDSLAMLRVAAEAGTTDIVASPHASLEFRFEPEVVAAKIAELKAASADRPRIHTGCDFHLTYDNVQDALANPLKYTINQKGYLLVEFSDLLIAKTMEDIFARMRQAGMTPIITHPERNWLLQQRMERLALWVESGCLLQVTAQSFFGRFGAGAKRFAATLMERDMVHFVASDAHDPHDRQPRLDEAYKHVARKYGQERAERLCIKNPRAALEGEPLEVRPPEPPSRPRKWYRLWA